MKNENSPPKEIGSQSCEVDAVIRPKKAFDFPILAKKFAFFSFEITCFWAGKAFEFPILAEKSISVLLMTFFFFLF